MTRTIRTCALALVLSAGLCYGTPPTDGQVDAAIALFKDATKDLTRDDPAAYNAAVKEAAEGALANISIPEMTIGQIETLYPTRMLTTAGKNDEAVSRLTRLARDRSAEGARAAVLRLAFLPPTYVGPEPKDGDAEARQGWEEANAKAVEARRTQEESLRVALEHPGLGEALRAGQAGTIFAAIAQADREVMREVAPGVLALGNSIAADLPADRLPSTVTLYEALMSAEGVDPVARERLRVRLTDTVRHASASSDIGTETGAALHKRLKRAEAFLDGAYARGELLGHSAPDVHFTWTNAKEPFTSLADFKGKVVVLDFWATWCGPCVASFPEVRTLAAHYEGYPVAIVGVTSLQGYHISRPEGLTGKPERIDTKDDPEKEYGLMPEFIRQLDMTWTVAFSAEEVFNPDYGVRGIPHVVIIDPAGVVRYRGIHPSGPLKDKAAKIDGLLKEFNLPTPPVVEEAVEAPKK